ncbi:hypothetical protein [Dyella sp. A6]|uniref:hypothetical protein n=1 Tax=Dyella aluminiiresistens TaxID=3069105 RepID=UPI002E790F57|nr:hypothetical protein [Dyella sp. A6]
MSRRMRSFLVTVGLVLALVFCMSSASAAMLPWSALHGKTVLLVTGSTEPGQPNDDALVHQHLESLGFKVKTVDDNAPESSALGVSLIVISSTANANRLGDRYADVAVPIFTWNTFDYPNLGMTGPELHRDFGVVDPIQHFADSFMILYGYGASTTSEIGRAVGLKPQLFGTLYLEPGHAGWGRPGPGATVVADFNGSPHMAAVFTYERNASMLQRRVAPARRVGFFLGNGNFHLLTAVHGPAAHDPQMRSWAIGLKLFDTALRWAASPPPHVAPYDPTALDARLRKAAHGKKVLYVERVNGGEGREADQHIVAHLRSLGFDVDVADQTAPQSRADGKDLVLISSTCSKYKLANKYADVAVPVISMEGLDADALHLAGRHRYVDYGEHGEEHESDDPPENYLDIVGAGNPMAAGLTPGLVQFSKHPGVLKWAVPTPDAVVIATLPNAPEQRAIFGYPKGSVMADGFVAPARRAQLPMDNPTYDDLTTQGHALFDAVVLWSIGG